MAISITSIFTDHPRSIGETYAEHAATAFSFGWHMAVGGVACMIHAVFPGVFVKTASRTIVRLDAQMRGRTPPPEGVDDFCYVI